MFRMKRTHWMSLGLVLAVLLLPIPASAGGFWETAAQGWEGVWMDLLKWLSGAESCAAIDPDGCPGSSSTDLGSTGSESSAAIDPLGQPPAPETCAMIDPDGCPG